MAEKATQEVERIYTIPLRAVKSSPRNHQADRAIRHIKRFLTQHMKSEDVWIDASVNEAIWAHGMYTVPSKIRVRARKFDDGVVEVSLPEIETKESIRGEIKARQEKAKGESEEDKKKGKKGEEKDEKAPAVEPKKTPYAQRKVIDIEGVGPAYDAKLRGAGVELMDQLVKANIEDLAKKTEVSETLLRTWQAMADLDRLDSVNNQYAELLVRAGVFRVKQLADASPEDIVKKIEAYLKTVEKAPTTQPVNPTVAGVWIREARMVEGQSTDRPAPKKGK